MSPPRGIDDGKNRRELGAVRLARDGGLSLRGALVRQIAIFGVTFLIAQVLGANALGVYAQAFALRAVLVLVSMLGMRIAMTYFVATFRAEDDPGSVRGAVRIGLIATGVVSVAIAAVTIVLAPTLANEFFNDSDLTLPIQLAAMSLPFVVVMTVALAATQGFKTMRAFAGIAFFYEPSTRLILTGAVLALGMGVEATLVALLVSSATAGVMAIRALRKRLAALGPGKMRFPIRAVSTFAGFSWVASTATQGLLWADIIVLGALVTSGEVGIYQVATRIVLLATFMIAPLTASLAPRVTDSWKRGDRTDVREHYKGLTGWTWQLSLPIFVVLVVFTDFVLRLFGDDFVVGRTVTLTLAIGALIEPLAAPASVVLNQVGKNRLNMFFAVGALTVDLALVVILVPILGIEGAAIAWTVSLLVFGVSRIVAVRRLVTGCYPWSRSHAKGAIAALAALIVGVAFTEFVVMEALIETIVGSMVVAIVYVGVRWMLGVSPMERRMLSSSFPSVSKLPLFRSATVHRYRNRRLTQRLEVPTEAVRLDYLISPLRYDILVRADLFQLARENRDLIETDLDAFVELAKRTDYFVWFCEVAASVVGINTDDPTELNRGFSRRVTRSVALMERYERNGGNHAESPVTVRRVADEETPTGKRILGERLVPVDGCHRLALLYLDGREYVDASEYRLTSAKAPIVDNTPTLIGALHLERTEYYRFVGTGYLDEPVETREELIAKASARGEDVRGEVDAVLAVDELYFSPSSLGPSDHLSQAE